MTALLTPEDIVAGIVLGLAALAAIIAALVKVVSQLTALRTQFGPDHGGTMRDAVDRIERAQRGMARDIGRLADADNSIRDHIDAETTRLWAAVDHDRSRWDTPPGRITNERDTP